MRSVKAAKYAPKWARPMHWHRFDRAESHTIYSSVISLPPVPIHTKKTIQTWLNDPTIIITTNPMCELQLFKMHWKLQMWNLKYAASAGVWFQVHTFQSSFHAFSVMSENISAQDMRTACATRQLHLPCKWAFITADNHQLAGSLGETVIVQREAVRMTACFLPKRQCSCSCASLHESIKPG